MIWSVIGWALLLAIATVVLYIVVGILLLFVWGLGTVIHSARLIRWSKGWWSLPFDAADRVTSLLDKLTGARTAHAWQVPDPTGPEIYRNERAGGLLGTLVLWGLAIVGGFVVLVYAHDHLLQPLAGGPAALPSAVLGAVAVVGLAGSAWILSERYPTRRPSSFRLCVSGAVVLGVFTYLLIDEIGTSDRLVSDYCAYGSVSDAQLEGCKSHVTANHVRSLDTVAAAFAAGDSTAVCGMGSGPFCQDVLNRRDLEEQAPPPGQ